LAVCGATLLLTGCGCPDSDVRVTGTGSTTRLDVCAERARTADERRQGLRGREPLPEGRGLLLEFPVEDEVCIFNEGVDFAIDAVYADATGRVVAVERRIPAGDGSSRCHRPVQYILELRAGVARDVREGDRLQASGVSMASTSASRDELIRDPRTHTE
jgi:uncharacterized membrane protein (UPF0127 family)